MRHAYDGLTDDQLAWTCPETGLSIAQLLYHVAGSEHYWGTRLAGRPADETEFEARLDSFALPRFLESNEALAPDELNRESVEKVLAHTYELFRSVVGAPVDPTVRKVMPSPQGDVVNGREGLVRVAQGTAAHAGRIWALRAHPEFPVAA